MLKLFLILLFPITVFSQTQMPMGTMVTPNTECGADGVGRTASGNIVRMALPGNRVNEQGNWIACDRPCIGNNQYQKFLEWSESGNKCTSAVPEASSGLHHSRFQGVLHQQYADYVDFSGRYNGMLRLRCDDGAMRKEIEVCRDTLMGGCNEDVAVAESRPGGSKRWYYYNASRTPVNNGGVVKAVAENGRTMDLVCREGRLIKK